MECEYLYIYIKFKSKYTECTRYMQKKPNYILSKTILL